MWVFVKHFNCSSVGRERGKMGNIWEMYKVRCHNMMVGQEDQEDRVRNRHGSKLRQLDSPLCLCLER